MLAINKTVRTIDQGTNVDTTVVLLLNQGTHPNPDSYREGCYPRLNDAVGQGFRGSFFREAKK